MKNVYFILLITSLLSLTSCVEYVEYDEAKERGLNVPPSEIVTYKVISYDPPKHFQIDIQDMSSGMVYHNINVSKHCNNHRSNEIVGTTFTAVKKYAMKITDEDTTLVSMPVINKQELYCKYCK
jgi:hypothetical protein